MMVVVENFRSEIAASLHDTATAFSDARDVILVVETALSSAASALDEGADVMELLSRTRIKEQREMLQPALEKMGSTRHQFRLLLAAQCAANGMNAREISELWGFSRQRAASLIKESQGMPHGASPE